jgi:hypothetical protein
MQDAKRKLKKKIVMSLFITSLVLMLVFLVGVTNIFAQEQAPAAGTK